MKLVHIITALSLFTAASCAAAFPQMVDPQATPETVALYHNLFVVGADHVLFGHQDTLAYGHDWIGDAHRSDVKDVCGDFPAVDGWDIGILEPRKPDTTTRFVRPDREKLLAYFRETYARGGLVTCCWHQSNPVTKANAWDVTPALATLLPGGANNESYKKTLDNFAAFFKELSPMPVIFRPYHEHNGDWFWWGKGHADEKDFIALWRFTVEYLRDVKGVHNLIYAFSPDRTKIELATFDKDYLYGYPGDGYVDVFGLDDYRDAAPHKGEVTPTMEVRQQEFAKSLEDVVKLADAHNKLPALTETGDVTLDVPNWYTNVLLKSIETNEYTRRIAWAQVWRNADAKVENMEHFYAPYPGHPSVPDFIEFYKSPFTMFEADLPDMYHEKAK